MSTNHNQRLLALDVLRGITIAGMLLVNNPGSWSTVYAPLLHAQWNGLTPTDLVFPFFLFIMGISTYLSLKKQDFACSRPVVWKILRRTAVIFLIGLGIGWFSRFCGTFNDLADEGMGLWQRIGASCWTFDRMRTLGVLQRLALSYGVAAGVAVAVKHRYIPWIIASALGGYGLLLALGNGFDISENNVIGIVDRALLGSAHMYREGDIAFDPEGLLSTIPSIAHVLIGFWCGRWIASDADIHLKIEKLLLTGVVLTFSGWLLSYGFPINKKIWSPTFVLTTCGMAAGILGLLIWLIDIKKHQRWSGFFETFGVNPLFLYITAAVLSILLNNISLPYQEGVQSLHRFIYPLLLEPVFGDYLGSLLYALLFVGLNWCIGYPLYKHKIYIKI